MEKRKTPVHDFAPSWLKINPYDSDLNSSNKKTDNHRSSSSGLSKLEETFDLRPQYLKQRNSNNKDPNTGSSHSNQKPVNQLSSSQLNTPFDCDPDRVGEESFRIKGWPSNITNSGNPPDGWSNNRHYLIKNKPSSNGVTNLDVLGDSVSRRSSNNTRTTDSGVINLFNVTNAGREDVNKINSGYSHHLQNSNFHHGIKGRSSNSIRDDSPLVSGDVVGEKNIKSKNNTKNGFADSNKFKEEFPSLVDEKQVNVETNNGNTVWDNVANKVFRSGSSKVSLVSRHLGSSIYGDKGPLTLNGEKSMNGSSYFRSLVPVVPRRKNVNTINGSSGSKDSTTLVNSLSNLSLGSTKILPVFSKPNHSSVSHSSITHSSASHSSPSHSMAILVKKHPKMKSNMTDFMPATLRSSSSDSHPDQNYEQRSNDPFDDDTTTSPCLQESNDPDPDDQNKDTLQGDKIKSQDNDIHLLSSSLEAEERLLREMGWKEEDEDENFYAPLTEDEVKEFKDLINKRKSLKRYMSPKIHQGRLKFQVNSNQLPLSQLNFLNTLATEDQNNDDTDTSSDDEDVSTGMMRDKIF